MAFPIPSRRPGEVRPWRRGKPAWMALLVLLLHSVPVRGAEHAPPRPPFLPARGSFSPDIKPAVERVFIDPTLSRAVKGRTARAPFEVLIAFFDAPEVTAAAARVRKLARYEVQMEGDWYQADDHDGARGTYRVLVRE